MHALEQVKIAHMGEKFQLKTMANLNILRESFFTLKRVF